MSIIHKIKVIGGNLKEDFYCNLCNYPLLSQEDFEKNKDYKCCYECYLEFAESRREKWKNGWRPEKTKLRDYILLKQKLNSREIKWH